MTYFTVASIVGGAPRWPPLISSTNGAAAVPTVLATRFRLRTASPRAGPLSRASVPSGPVHASRTLSVILDSMVKMAS